MDEATPPPDSIVLSDLRGELADAPPARGRRIVEKVFLAAIGAIPWVGGFIGAMATLRGEEVADRHDHLRTRWLEEHQRRLDDLRSTVEEIDKRFEALGPGIEERIQSDEYLGIVRRGFRAWDEAETNEKRAYVANLITNAAGYTLTSDDVVRLFIDWLELYHEAHFAVIRHVHQNPGATRYDIWQSIRGDVPREDSPEADLYKMLIRDLSTGGVIRQARDTDGLGRFLKKRPASSSRPASRVLESAFEDEKPYVLTELGKQFVHYTMNEIVPRVGTTDGSA